MQRNRNGTLAGLAKSVYDEAQKERRKAVRDQSVDDSVDVWMTEPDRCTFYVVFEFNVWVHLNL